MVCRAFGTRDFCTTDTRYALSQIRTQIAERQRDCHRNVYKGMWRSMTVENRNSLRVVCLIVASFSFSVIGARKCTEMNLISNKILEGNEVERPRDP